MKLQQSSMTGQDGAVSSAEVVIADDDPGCLEALKDAFGIQGLKPIVCRDGKQAWEAIVKNPRISLVVVNWMLPGMDGHEICRLLRKTRPWVSAVLMVGQRFFRDAWSAMDLQAKYVLTKPFPKTGLDSTIRKIAADALGR